MPWVLLFCGLKTLIEMQVAKNLATFFFFHKIKLQFELCTAIFRNIAIDFVDMHIP